MKLSISEAIKTLWPIFMTIIGAVVYVIIALDNKASSQEVTGHSIKIQDIERRMETENAKLDYLTKTIFKVAAKAGVNPDPPP